MTETIQADARIEDFWLLSQDREAIVRTLDDPQTDSLAELRGVLLREHEWRVREGLV